MKIVFIGSPEFAVPTLKALAGAHEVSLVVTQPDRVRGRGQKTSPTEVKAAALELGLPVITPEKLSDPGVMDDIKNARPDAIALVASGFFLKKDALDLPPLGCINAHASLLPRYRGAAPIQWAIANGEKNTGVTTMKMNQGMDTGDILLKKEIAIEERDTGGSLHDKLAPMAALLMIETLAGLEAGSIKPVPQDNALATYAPQLKKDDGKIDWAMAANEIALRVRAFDPWPGTFALIEDVPLKITGARAENLETSKPPGTILSADKNGIVITCKKGALRAIEVQPRGKRKMEAADFLAGHRLSPGDRLG